MDWCTTDDIRGDTWRRVLDYANVDLALDAISARHGASAPRSRRANYKKQALQIRGAVLQAQEYFQAAEGASLFTAPNHLYYGLVSLASTIMLLRGTGDKSLDRLRQDSRNAHHGLKFSTGLPTRRASEETELFKNSFVEVLSNGHFLNWFTELPRYIPAYVTVCREGRDVQTTTMEVFGRISIGTPRRVVGQKDSLSDLIQHLPDLDATLSRYLIPVVSSRATHQIAFDERGTATHSWTMHGAGDHESLLMILERFRFRSDLYSAVEIVNEHVEDSIIFTVSIPHGSRARFVAPSSRYTTDYQQIVYAARLGHEFVDMYRLCFGLSMLARYYPDLWIACLDSHCRGAKLIEAAVATMLRKAPLLALELVSGHPIVVSTQRPPWLM